MCISPSSIPSFQGASCRDLNPENQDLCSNGIHKNLSFPACTPILCVLPQLQYFNLQVVCPRDMPYCPTLLFFFFLSVFSVSEWMAGGLVDRFLWKNIPAPYKTTLGWYRASC